MKSNQTLFSDLYPYKHVMHDEIYILGGKDGKEDE